MHPAASADLADSVQLILTLPRTVYNSLAEIWGREGDVAELAAALLAQAVTFGTPADLYEDVDATARELAALQDQLEAVALLLADVDVGPFLTQR